jgi:hypothetical protein
LDSALIGLSINSIALPLSNRHDNHQHLVFLHLINQPKSGGTQLDFVAITGTPQLAGGDLRFDQPFNKFVFELLPDPGRELLPFPQGLGMKDQLKGHQG